MINIENNYTEGINNISSRISREAGCSAGNMNILNNLDESGATTQKKDSIKREFDRNN